MTEPASKIVGVIVPDPMDERFEIYRLTDWFAHQGAPVRVLHESLDRGSGQPPPIIWTVLLCQSV